MRCNDQKRAENRNELVHVAIRALAQTQAAMIKSFRVMSLTGHLEDLGWTHHNIPASVWQLPEMRKALAGFELMTVAGHQC